MGLERNEGKEKEKEGERWAQMRRETKNEREHGGKRKSYGLLSTFRLHPPFSSNSNNCATVRELEVIASAFHRQEPVHSLELLSANRQPRRKSSNPTSPQECISHWFVSRITPPELALPNISPVFPLLFLFLLPHHWRVSRLPTFIFLRVASPSLPNCCCFLSLPALMVMQLVVLKLWSGVHMGAAEEGGVGWGGGGGGSLREPAQFP